MTRSFSRDVFLQRTLWNVRQRHGRWWWQKSNSWSTAGSLCIQCTTSKCLWVVSKSMNTSKRCPSWTSSPPNTPDVLISPTSGSLKPEVHAVWSWFIYFKLSTNEDSNSSVPFTRFSRPQLVLSLIFWGGAQKQCTALRGAATVGLVGAVSSSPLWSISDPATENTTCFEGHFEFKGNSEVIQLCNMPKKTCQWPTMDTLSVFFFCGSFKDKSTNKLVVLLSGTSWRLKKKQSVWLQKAFLLLLTVHICLFKTESFYPYLNQGKDKPRGTFPCTCYGIFPARHS